MLALLLGDYPPRNRRNRCRTTQTSSQTCRRPYPPVGPTSELQRRETSDRPFRKLLAIDYVGVLLTLIGCTLLILPLVWVSCH